MRTGGSYTFNALDVEFKQIIIKEKQNCLFIQGNSNEKLK